VITIRSARRIALQPSNLNSAVLGMAYLPQLPGGLLSILVDLPYAQYVAPDHRSVPGVVGITPQLREPENESDSKPQPLLQITTSFVVAMLNCWPVR
jgi:hypothetical protein